MALSSELLGAKEGLFSWKKKKENPALPGLPWISRGVWRSKVWVFLSSYINDFALHCIQHTGTRVRQETVPRRHVSFFSGKLTGKTALTREGWPWSRFYRDSPNYNPSEPMANSPSISEQSRALNQLNLMSSNNIFHHFLKHCLFFCTSLPR